MHCISCFSCYDLVCVSLLILYLHYTISGFTCVSCLSVLSYVVFFFEGYGDHRDLHVLTHSFPTRRSSELARTSASDRLATSSSGRTTPVSGSIRTSTRLPSPLRASAFHTPSSNLTSLTLV